MSQYFATLTVLVSAALKSQKKHGAFSKSYLAKRSSQYDPTSFIFRRKIFCLN